MSKTYIAGVPYMPRNTTAPNSPAFPEAGDAIAAAKKSMAAMERAPVAQASAPVGVTDPMIQAAAEWQANAHGCRESFVSEKIFVAARAAELRGMSRIAGRDVPPLAEHSPTFTPTPAAKAQAEWAAMNAAQRSAWKDEKTFVAAVAGGPTHVATSRGVTRDEGKSVASAV